MVFYILRGVGAIWASKCASFISDIHEGCTLGIFILLTFRESNGTAAKTHSTCYVPKSSTLPNTDNTNGSTLILSYAWRYGQLIKTPVDIA